MDPLTEFVLTIAIMAVVVGGWLLFMRGFMWALEAVPALVRYLPERRPDTRR